LVPAPIKVAFASSIPPRYWKWSPPWSGLQGRSNEIPNTPSLECLYKTSIDQWCLPKWVWRELERTRLEWFVEQTSNVRLHVHWAIYI